MKRMLPGLLAAALLAVSAVGIACSDDGSVDTDKARDQAQTIRNETRQAWANMRADGDRLIDQIQTRSDPDAKQQLLDRCRDSHDRMQKEDASNADRVNRLCDRIRNTDPSAQSAWNEIKSEFRELNNRIGGS